jgi:hypothetical protein
MELFFHRKQELLPVYVTGADWVPETTVGMLLGDPDFNSHQVLHHLVCDKGNGDGGHDLHRKGDRSIANSGRPNVAGSWGALGT